MPVLARAPRKPPQRQLVRSGVVPAPTGGINATDPATAFGPVDAFELVNMVAGRAGLMSRLGYSEWCIGMTNAVRTVIPFKGSTDAKDRLFAANSDGIWDCTSSSATPTKVFSWATTGLDAGWSTFAAFTTSAGHFILLTDEQNGYHLYTESTDTWAAVATGAGAGQINGVTAANLAFVTVWKNRVFFAEKDTANCWYLPVGVYAGTVSALRLGNRLQHGGDLRGMWAMTIDGGQGVDDFLAFVGGGGDVLLYQGTDPSTAGAFENVGAFFLGAIPAGRRIASDFGGDLLILSLLGVVPLSKLRSGAFGPDLYATRKIANLFNSYGTSARRALDGWALVQSPEENCVLVNTPLVGDSYEQLALSLTTGGWSLFRDRPALCASVYKGSLYIGTVDGRLCKVGGDLDDVKLSGAATYTNVDWSVLTAFQSLGSLGYKTLQEAQPLMISDGAPPGYGIEARYDFDTADIATTPADPGTGTAPLVGTATLPFTLQAAAECGEIRGLTGTGRHAALAFRGRSNARVTLMGFNVWFTEGR